MKIFKGPYYITNENGSLYCFGRSQKQTGKADRISAEWEKAELKVGDPAADEQRFNRLKGHVKNGYIVPVTTAMRNQINSEIAKDEAKDEAKQTAKQKLKEQDQKKFSQLREMPCRSEQEKLAFRKKFRREPPRAIHLPVATVAGADWRSEFIPELEKAWKRVTRAANAVNQILFGHDLTMMDITPTTTVVRKKCARCERCAECKTTKNVRKLCERCHACARCVKETLNKPDLPEYPWERLKAFCEDRGITLKSYTYAIFRDLAGEDYESSSAASISNKIQADYMKRRQDVLGNMVGSFPAFKYPYPLLINEKDAFLSAEDHEYEDQAGNTQQTKKYFLTFDLNRKSFKIELKTSKRFPQIAKLNEIIESQDHIRIAQEAVDSAKRAVKANGVRAGEALKKAEAILNSTKELRTKLGEVQISARPASVGGNGFFVRGINGSSLFKRVYVSIASSAARPLEDEQKPNVWIVHTSHKEFLIARASKSVVWRLHSEQIINNGYFNPKLIARRIEEHRNRTHEVTEDMKYRSRSAISGEKNNPPNGMRAFRTDLESRQNNRIETLVHNMARRLADKLHGERVTKVVFVDTSKRVKECQTLEDRLSFPWFNLKKIIKDKLAMCRPPIEFEERGWESKDTDPNWTAAVRHVRDEARGAYLAEQRRDQKRKQEIVEPATRAVQNRRQHQPA